jgi:hypothetical protein
MCEERGERAQKARRLIDGAKKCIELLRTKLAQVPDDDSAAEKLTRMSEVMTELETLVEGIGQLATGHASSADDDRPVSKVAAPAESPPRSGRH